MSSLQNDDTPLLYACHRNDIDVVTVSALLTVGANSNVCNKVITVCVTCNVC